MYGGATFIRLSSIYVSDISRMFLFHERDLCTGSICLEIKTWKRSGSTGYYEHKELKKSCIAIYGYYTRYLWSVERNGKLFFILIFTENLLACGTTNCYINEIILFNDFTSSFIHFLNWTNRFLDMMLAY